MTHIATNFSKTRYLTDLELEDILSKIDSKDEIFTKFSEENFDEAVPEDDNPDERQD